MQDIPREQIQKRYQLLSPSLQEAIFSEKTTDIILRNCALREIPNHNIHTVGRLTSRVLLGYLRPETFAFEIQKEAGIDALKATQIAHDIDTEIFSEVRLELKKLYPPTIQTPTVQSQGFAPSQPTSSQATEQIKPAPRYVVQIPDRFKRTAPWQPQQPQSTTNNPQPTPSTSSGLAEPVTDNSKPTIQNEGVTHPAPMPITPVLEQKSVAPAPMPSQPLQQSQSKPATQAPPQPASPPMDPVVPLPTFIQSKFKQGIPEQQKPTGGTQETTAQDTLKNAFGKFTVSSTAPETKKEPVSPYRETIEEPKKPSAKPQGKVIDLSQF